ncbi:HAMP domain-containing histidine kinase [Cutibacterium sp. WCA-380-WT-3A]|uniref:histidine kinase n=1 Tax=Cutibacterium porci TaxID=2605781 RepID=A0A7K0J8K0_9ACTN|nr:HAMP domain-containing histidine kinase [Cutibacterium porci]
MWLEHPLGPHTLGRQLVIRVLAIISLLAVAVGGLTIWGTHQILTDDLDEQVTAAFERQAKHPFGLIGPRANDVIGIQAGTVLVIKTGEACFQSTITEGAVITKNCSTEAHILLDVRCDQRPHNFDVDGGGQYRAMASTSHNVTHVVALPRTRLIHAIERLLILEATITALALVVSFFATRAVVTKSLRPLNRLASTATIVSQMDLGSGEVDLPIRVDPPLADPRSEVGQVGHALNHMLNNVEDALTSRQESEVKIRRFMADASHELRNPLASIRGYAELTRRRRDEMSPEGQFAIDRIEAEATRMSALVEDMLLLTRLGNNQKLELTPVDLVEIVLNAVSDSRAAGMDHTWTLDLPNEEITVLADPDRLMQVVVNVLSNARKHTPAGVTVHTTVSTQKGQAIVVVADNGPGIPESVRPVIFERFSRADTARTSSKEGSTGLGMSIVAAVMAAHHGTARVDSSMAGTTVTLTLPLAR